MKSKKRCAKRLLISLVVLGGSFYLVSWRLKDLAYGTEEIRKFARFFSARRRLMNRLYVVVRSSSACCNEVCNDHTVAF